VGNGLTKVGRRTRPPICLIGIIASIALVARGAKSGPTTDETTVLLCQGSSNVNGLGYLQTWKYYKVGAGHFFIWDEGDVRWSGDQCADDGASCDSGLTFYTLRESFKSVDGENIAEDIQINRQTGYVQDGRFVGNSGVTFRGNCQVAADPAVPTAPNRF